ATADGGLQHSVVDVVGLRADLVGQHALLRGGGAVDWRLALGAALGVLGAEQARWAVRVQTARRFRDQQANIAVRTPHAVLTRSAVTGLAAAPLALADAARKRARAVRAYDGGV